MLLADLNTGNDLIKKINEINTVLATYNDLRITQGIEASAITIQFSEFGTIYFEDSNPVIIDSLAATFINNLTAHRNTLQQQFDNLCSDGGGAA